MLDGVLPVLLVQSNLSSFAWLKPQKLASKLHLKAEKKGSTHQWNVDDFTLNAACILQNNLFWYFCYSFLASLLTFCNAVIKLTAMTDLDYIKMPCDKIVKSRFTLTKEIMLTQRPFDVYSNIHVYCKALETWKNSQIFDLSLAKALKSGKKNRNCIISTQIFIIFYTKYYSSFKAGRFRRSSLQVPIHLKRACSN